MLSLYERAKADNRRILNTAFHATATFTAPVGSGIAEQTAEIFYADINLDIDVQTGLPVRARKIAAHVHHADLALGTPVEVAGDWKVAFTNNVGGAILGIVESPILDRTLGQMTFVVKLLKVLPPTPP
ncbi:MAG: hypothetical protein IMZ69_08405, partial [Spirochaetes bacterium]|nr:hypothetical protein [Spirochaetota bacterium]